MRLDQNVTYAPVRSIKRAFGPKMVGLIKSVPEFQNPLNNRDILLCLKAGKMPATLKSVCKQREQRVP